MVYNKYKLNVNCNNGMFYYKIIKNKFIEFKSQFKKSDNFLILTQQSEL